MPLSTLSIFAITAYITSGTLFAVRLFAGKQQQAIKLAALGLCILAVLIHGFELHRVLPISSQLNLNLFRTIEILTWLMSALVLTLSVRYPIESMGWIILPATAASALIANLWPQTAHLTRLSGSTIQNLHILASLLAFSLIGIAVLQALLVSYQRRQLKRKRVRHLLNILPPLKMMESMLFQLIRGGFILLTFSLASGYYVLEDLVGQKVSHKVFFACIAWLIFGALVLGRSYWGWRGKTALKSVYIGFCMLLLGFLGSKFVFQYIISY